MIARPHVFVPLTTEQGCFIVNRLDSNQHASGAAFGVAHQLFERGSFDPG